MHIEEHHWNHAQALLETILRVQTEHSPEAALHILVQQTLTLLGVNQGCLVLKEPRSTQWKPALWAGEGAVEMFNPVHVHFASILEGIREDTLHDSGKSREVWVTASMQAPYLTAAPMYLNQRLAGLIACASALPLDEETKKNAIILAHISSIILGNAQNARLNNITIEEKTKSDALRSNLIALSSHEMRTPLSVILGYADLLRDIGTEDIQSSIAAIRESGKSLLETVNTMTNLMDVLGSNAMLSALDIDVLATKIEEIQEVGKISFTNINCKEIYCDVNLIANAVNIIASESSSPLLIATSKEKQGTRIDLDTSISKDNIFLEYLVLDQGNHINADKFNQNSFISAFKIANIISMHEGWIKAQDSPTSDGTLITIWFPDLPLSRFNY